MRDFEEADDEEGWVDIQDLSALKSDLTTISVPTFDLPDPVKIPLKRLHGKVDFGVVRNRTIQIV